jgi:A/G-specific adenine glycosylase
LQTHCVAYPTIHGALQVAGRSRKGESIPFEQTNRYFRGRIVDALRSAPEGLPLAAIGPLVRDGFSDGDLPWLVDLVTGLERHGLVAIAEPRATYDAQPPSGESADGGWLVRLPD